MSRILKRPMFRKGGEVGGGIMSGIQTRTNLATAGFLPEENTEMGGGSARQMEQNYIQLMSGMNNPSEEKFSAIESIFPAGNIGRAAQMATDLYKKAYEGVAPTKDEILAKMLISGGLGGLSETGGGSTLANLARAFKKPAEEGVSEYFSGKRMGQQAAAKGVDFALGLELQKAKVNNKQMFREQLPESIVNEKLAAVRGTIAGNAYAKNYSKLLKATRAEIDVDVITDLDVDRKNNRIKPEYFKNKDNIIYIDPFTARFMKIKEGRPIQIDQNTFQEIKASGE